MSVEPLTEPVDLDSMEDHDLLVYVATVLQRIEPLLDLLDNPPPALRMMLPKVKG